MLFTSTPTPYILNEKLAMYCDAKNTASYAGSGNTWTDISGNGNNLTRNSANIAWNANGWWNFDGTNEKGQVIIASNQIVQRQGSFSISVVYRRNSAAAALADREQVFANAGGADGFRCGLHGSGIYYLIGGAGGTGYQEGYLGGTNIANNTWQTITWVFDRGAELGSYRVYAYQNGVITTSHTITAGAGGNTTFQAVAAAIGYNQCCALLRGDIAAIIAYNKAQNASEVLFNYYALKALHSLV